MYGFHSFWMKATDNRKFSRNKLYTDRYMHTKKYSCAVRDYICKTIHVDLVNWVVRFGFLSDLFLALFRGKIKYMLCATVGENRVSTSYSFDSSDICKSLFVRGLDSTSFRQTPYSPNIYCMWIAIEFGCIAEKIIWLTNQMKKMEYIK